MPRCSPWSRSCMPESPRWSCPIFAMVPMVYSTSELTLSTFWRCETAKTSRSGVASAASIARNVAGRPAPIGAVTPGNSTTSRSGSTGRVMRSAITRQLLPRKTRSTEIEPWFAPSVPLSARSLRLIHNNLWPVSVSRLETRRQELPRFPAACCQFGRSRACAIGAMRSSMAAPASIALKERRVGGPLGHSGIAGPAAA